MAIITFSPNTPVYQNAPANPNGTTSTAGVMMGLAGSITPNFSGRVRILITGNLTNSTGAAGNGAKAQIRYGTGAAPANAAALTGTAIGSMQQSVLERATANDSQTFCLCGLVGVPTPLTLGTPIWIDISVAAVAAGTAIANNLYIMADEI